MTKTPFFIRKARLDLIRSQNDDHLAVMRFRLLGKKIQFLAEDIWNWLSAPRVIALLMLLGGMLGFFMDYAFQQEYPVARSLSLENIEPEVGSIVRQDLPRQLKGAELRFSILKGAILEGADLRKTDLLATDLSGAHLNGANLQAANLRAANCARTDLRGAALEGSNLTDANLKDANISENFPICDRKTVMPDGTFWSSNHDLYRFVDPNGEDFWEVPSDKFVNIEDQRSVPEQMPSGNCQDRARYRIRKSI